MQGGCVLLIGKLLMLMAYDKYMEANDPIYFEVMDELYDFGFGIKDVLDTERLGARHLTTFGSLGKL
jgi:hypothetical protein